MAEIKLHPRDQLPNRVLIARAERLYQEHLGEAREGPCRAPDAVRARSGGAIRTGGRTHQAPISPWPSTASSARPSCRRSNEGSAMDYPWTVLGLDGPASEPRSSAPMPVDLRSSVPMRTPKRSRSWLARAALALDLAMAPEPGRDIHASRGLQSQSMGSPRERASMQMRRMAIRCSWLTLRKRSRSWTRTLATFVAPAISPPTAPLSRSPYAAKASRGSRSASRASEARSSGPARRWSGAIS